MEDSGVSPTRKRKARWDAGGVRALRKHLGLSQHELAEELGTRQQTISEWETGVYQPRGMSERLLGIIAERSSFVYGAPPDDGGALDAGASDG
jgi:DNA-binding transcriptional regulator YiaG